MQKVEDDDSSEMKKIVFYHTYLDGNYKLIVQEQLTKIFTSGLYDACDSVEFHIASPEDSRVDWALGILKPYSKINPTVVKIDRSQYPADYRESKVTLLNLKNMAERVKGYYCYFHSKGVSNQGYLIDMWRNSNDYATIYRWKENIEMLDSGYDAVGPNLRYDTFLGYYPHFSGTYFWTTSKHIKTLDHSYLENVDNKYLEEFWIGSNHTAQLGSTFECGHNEPYLTEASIDSYIKDDELPEISHFYHVYADGNWQVPVSEHISMLKNYGLLHKLRFFGIGLVGSKENVKKVKELLDFAGIKYETVYQSDGSKAEEYEQETLDALYKYSQENSGYVFYAHTKGSTNTDPVCTVWRRSMEYYTNILWRKAANSLKSHDIAGCHWLTPEEYPSLVTLPFFGGNYWWANLSYVKELGAPKRETRWDAEGWIGEGKDIKAKDFFPGFPGPELFNKR
jgi:hypothetical protein